MTLSRHLTILSAILLGFAPGVCAAAGGSPLGTWIDHSGEGAVEITDCGGKLCGRIVWLKKAENNSTCSLQVIGNAKAVSGGKWDGGWIYDPDSQSKYDVEITPIKGDRLKVYGYAGSKLFGETMTWTRAPLDLKRCDKVEEAKVAPPVVAPAPPAAVAAEAPPREVAVAPTPAGAPGAASEPVTPADPAVVAPAPEGAATAGEEQLKADGAARPAAVPGQAAPAPKVKKPAQVAAKKAEEFEIDGIKVRLAKGKCGVTIKELGSFDFPCD